MEYNFREIGKNIAKLRKEAGYKSQDALIEKIPIGRNTLSAIEQGKANHFDLTLLVALCKLFDCDMEHILIGHENCKTRNDQFIHDETGLSAKAIERLKEAEICIRKYSDNSEPAIRRIVETERLKLDFINTLITSHDWHVLARSYVEVKAEKQVFAQRETKYKNEKEKCDAIEMSKEDFYDALYANVRDASFKALMDYQRFLDK